MEATPIEVVQRQRLRIIAVMNYEGEQAEEMKRKQDEQQRELDRQKARSR